MRADGPAACASLAPREGGTPPRPRKLLEGRPALLSCAPSSFGEDNRDHEDAGRLPLPSCAPVCEKIVKVDENNLSDGFNKPSLQRSLASSSNNDTSKCKSSKKTPSPDIARIINNNNIFHREEQTVCSERGREAFARIIEKQKEENENEIILHSTNLSTTAAVEIIKQDNILQNTPKVKRNPKSAEVFVHRQNLQPAREESIFNTEQLIIYKNSDHINSNRSNDIDKNYQKPFSNISAEFKSGTNSSNSDSESSDRLVSNEEDTKTFEEVISKATAEMSLPEEDGNTSSFENAASANDSGRTSYDSFKNIECDTYLETFGESSSTHDASASPCARSWSDAETPSSSRLEEYRISPHRNSKAACRSKRNRHKSVSDYKCISLDNKASKNEEVRGAENDIELRNIGDETSLFDRTSAEKKRAECENLPYVDMEKDYANCSSNSSCDTLPLNEPKIYYPHTMYRSHHLRRNISSRSKNNSFQFGQKNIQNYNLYSFPGYRSAKEMSSPKINEVNVNIIGESSADVTNNNVNILSVDEASDVQESRDSIAGGPLENFSSLYTGYSRSIPKSRSCVETSSASEEVPARPLSLAGRRAARAVRHRNAEEALSCLLWQPYECREGGEGRGGEHGESGHGAHSLLAARYGETCALAMRLTVPAPAHCRAVRPAHLADSEPKRVGDDPVQPDSVLSDERVSVSDNTVSVNGEVIGCRLVTSSCSVSQTSIQHSPRTAGAEVERTRVRVLQDAPCRSWASCGAQTEEPPAPPLAPPPYSTLPHAHPALPLPVQPPHAYPFQPVSLRRCQYGEDSEPPKTCCGAVGARALGLKWFIVLVALAGICCVLVGTVLGAVRAQGRAHLTVLLLMIGVGLVLVTVSGVAWRAVGRRRARAGAARGAATNGPGGAARRGAACARAHHPYAAMLYPEFHCRPPPPSYQASMHEYRLRLLLLDRAASPPPVACPPPAYRPRPRGMAGGGPPYMGRGARGRRRPEPRTPAPTLSAVVIQNIALEPYDEVKYDDGPEMEPPIGSETKEEEVQHENKEGNLVTIVQTGLDTSPVIVTVSGSMPEERTNQTHTSEIDILAHL